MVTISKIVGPRPEVSTAPATASAAPSGDHAGATWPARPTARGAASPGSNTIGTGGPPRELTYAIGPLAPGKEACADAGTRTKSVAMISARFIPARRSSSSPHPDGPGLDRRDPQHGVHPRVGGQALADRLLALEVQEQERLAVEVLADRAAEDDDTVLGERVHAARMLVPAVLFAARPGLVP